MPDTEPEPAHAMADAMERGRTAVYAHPGPNPITNLPHRPPAPPALCCCCAVLLLCCCCAAAVLLLCCFAAAVLCAVESVKST